MHSAYAVFHKFGSWEKRKGAYGLMQKKLSIITDAEGNKLVQAYVKQYVGENYKVLESSDVVYIGTDFPEEVKGSEDTIRTKGGNEKAKANATTVLPYLIENATNKRWQENYKSKHGDDAKFGWYRFSSRFAIPYYGEKGNLEGYNVYRIEMLIRHASDGKLYLYDIVNTRKEARNPLEQ